MGIVGTSVRTWDEGAVLGILTSNQNYTQALARQFIAAKRSGDDALSEGRELRQLENKAANVLRAIEEGAVELGTRFSELQREIETLRGAREGKAVRNTALTLDAAAVTRVANELRYYIETVYDRAVKRNLIRMTVSSIEFDFVTRTGTLNIGLPGLGDGGVARIEHCGGWI